MALRLRHSYKIATALAAAATLAATTARAAITPTGDVFPTNIALWNGGTSGRIGNTAAGSIAVTLGSNLLSSTDYLGYATGSSGTVIVDGTSSKWTANTIYVGYQGAGTATLISGAQIANNFNTYIANAAGSTGIVNVTGTGSLWNATSLFVGFGGAGSLSLTTGGKVTTNAPLNLGVYIGSSGAILVDGTGSTLTYSGINVGNLGSGALTIAHGGSASGFSATLSGGQYPNPATARAVVDGAGSLWNSPQLTVGYFGNATLDITHGGKLLNNVQCAAGILPGSSASITLDGTSSTWTGGNLYLGNSGNATLNITGGAQASHTYSTLGYATNSSGTVVIDGAGSQWSNSMLYIGSSGTGNLTIRNGGSVISGGASIGAASPSNGTVIVDGTGSSWTTATLTVGAAGHGTLNIANGATITSSGATYVGSTNTGVGAINFGTNGGSLVTQSLYIAPNQLGGTGTINTRGLVSDLDLVFDTTHGLNQTFLVNNSNQNVSLNVDLTGTSGAVGDLGVGYRGTGTLLMRDGITVNSMTGNIGYGFGAAGTATITGAGTNWNASLLRVGNSGNGTLNIFNGSHIAVGSSTFVAANSTATGSINFGANGGTLTTGSLYATPTQFTGTGTINTSGLISDVDLVLDHAHGLNQTLLFNGSGQNVTLNLDLTGASGPVRDLGAGHQGRGTLTIQDGLTINSQNIVLGNKTGSVGTATVSGPGSTWTFSSSASVGNLGQGVLNILNGGKVTSIFPYVYTTAYIGLWGSGALNVDGSGSMWNSNGELDVGLNSTGSSMGVLKVTNGGNVTAGSLSIINANSILIVNVGDGSSIRVGGFTNSATLRLCAVAGATTGTYTPILSTGGWSDVGIDQAIGGNWNTTTHTFTVSAPAATSAGTPIALDLTQTQRVIITDPTAPARSVNAAFPGNTDTTSTLTFTALPLTTDQSALLAATLPAGASIYSGWTFTASGYTTGTPVFLSLQVGPGFSTDTLSLWHFDGSTWSPYSAPDLSYDGTFASFTVTGFSGYAVTAAPEPASLALLLAGAAAMIQSRRRTPRHTPPLPDSGTVRPNRHPGHPGR